MKLIKTALLCSSIAFSYNALAQSVDIQTLNKSLKPWQPAEIVQTSNSIKITLPANTVSSEAYEALISSGVCTPIWLKDAPTSFLKTTSEIHVVNKFSALGYTFEHPLTTCKKMGELMDDQAKSLMYGNTRTYTSK